MSEIGPDRSFPIIDGNGDSLVRSDITSALVTLLDECRARLERPEPVATRRGAANVRGARVLGVSLSDGEIVLEVERGDLRCVVLRTPVRDDAHEVRLSPREHEIARMVAKGFPNKTIATILDISPWTVSTHLRRLFAKFRVTSRAAMVARLLEERMAPAPPERGDAVGT